MVYIVAKHGGHGVFCFDFFSFLLLSLFFSPSCSLEPGVVTKWSHEALEMLEPRNTSELILPSCLFSFSWNHIEASLPCPVSNQPMSQTIAPVLDLMIRRSQERTQLTLNIPTSILKEQVECIHSHLHWGYSVLGVQHCQYHT